MTELRTAAQQMLEAPEGGEDSWQLVGPAIDGLKEALAEPAQEPDNGGKTGWPPGLLQDDCRGLSNWLASRPDARQRLREALARPVQEPGAHKHAWFRTGAMAPGEMRCIQCGAWNHEAAPPQRKPLTEEELKACLPPDAVRVPSGWLKFARAVEAAHGIK